MSTCTRYRGSLDDAQVRANLLDTCSASIPRLYQISTDTYPVIYSVASCQLITDSNDCVTSVVAYATIDANHQVFYSFDAARTYGLLTDQPPTTTSQVELVLPPITQQEFAVTFTLFFALILKICLFAWGMGRIVKMIWTGGDKIW